MFKLNKKNKSFIASVDFKLEICEVSYKKAISLMKAGLIKIFLPDGMDTKSEYFEEDSERYFELLKVLMENGFIGPGIKHLDIFRCGKKNQKATFI